jgi:hypothetical protein
MKQMDREGNSFEELHKQSRATTQPGEGSPLVTMKFQK